MDGKIWKLFVSLGVPGVALGVFYMLFRSFHWSFPTVPATWVGPIVVLFMLLTSAVVFYALTLWAPRRGPGRVQQHDGAKPRDRKDDDSEGKRVDQAAAVCYRAEGGHRVGPAQDINPPT